LGKAPDLLLRVDTARHQAFLDVVNGIAMGNTSHDMIIEHDTLVAIEVECGDETNLIRSIENNLVKDRAAGLTHIIFAVMPKHFQRAHLFIHAQDDERLLAVDALELLDALRRESHG
jgi:hypothetical protein